jgi:hypothetical protein
MTSFLFDLVSSVFRPAIAALAIAAALAIVSVDNNALTVSNSVVDISELGCSGMLKPICQLDLF